MLDCANTYRALVDAGIGFWTGVPDSLLKNFCAYVTDHAPAERHVIAANEGSAVGLAAGHYLATGEPAVVYLQNSGLGNTINPLTSLADEAVYGIPMLMIVGWRGEPGVKDAPQHRKMGDSTVPTLDAIGLPWEVLPDEDAAAADVIARTHADMMAARSPRALLIRKGLFGKYALRSDATDPYPMSREDALGAVLAAFVGAPVISTTGMPSREVFELRRGRGESHDSDFLTVGSMGHCSQIALGVANAQPGRPVLCIDGDGAALMHLGGLATIGSIGPPNFKHVVVNNGAHDSVGGQPTCGFAVSLTGVAKACGYAHVATATDTDSLARELERLAAADGPAMLEVRVRRGARADLGRPTIAPPATRDAFMEFLASDG